MSVVSSQNDPQIELIHFSVRITEETDCGIPLLSHSGVDVQESWQFRAVNPLEEWWIRSKTAGRQPGEAGVNMVGSRDQASTEDRVQHAQPKVRLSRACSTLTVICSNEGRGERGAPGG